MKTINIESPLAKGFCKGLLGNFDTTHQVSPAPTMTLADSIRKTAAKFKVHPRTVRRWHKAGVNLESDIDVASHIALKGRSAAALEAAHKLVTTKHHDPEN